MREIILKKVEKDNLWVCSMVNNLVWVGSLTENQVVRLIVQVKIKENREQTYNLSFLNLVEYMHIYLAYAILNPE